MKIGNPRAWGAMSVLVGLFILLAVVSACSSGDSEAVDLLQDSKFGLAHLNDEFHTIKGEDLLTSPTIGLAHLNDEFHTIKQLLADLSAQVEALQR